MHGVALARSEVPLPLYDSHALAEREHDRGGEREVRFLWRASPPLLPVWADGRLTLARWGNRNRRARFPVGEWTWRATVESGFWAQSGSEPVDVPATYILSGGVWTRVRHGVRGLLVRDRLGGATVFVVCEPATRYYRVMTGVEFQPVLVGEVI